MPDTIFGFANLAALLGWVLLIATLFVERLRPIGWRIAGLWLPLIFALFYVPLIALAWGGNGGFGSIAAVRALFADDRALAAGWLHYLAFDLFVGTWIARDGLRRRVPRAALVPVLLLTFLFGPAGLLVAMLVRQLGKGDQA